LTLALEAEQQMQALTQDQIDAANSIKSEPVAWKHDCDALCMGIELWIARCPHCGKPRSTHPQPAQWSDLTDDEIKQLDFDNCNSLSFAQNQLNFARATEAKLREKNT